MFGINLYSLSRYLSLNDFSNTYKECKINNFINQISFHFHWKEHIFHVLDNCF